MEYRRLIEQLEVRVSTHRRIIIEAVTNRKNYTADNSFLSGTEEESLLKLTRLDGYFKLFLEKLKERVNISDEDLSLVRRFEFAYNELLKEFSCYREVS